MADRSNSSPARILEAKAENPGMRARDLADKLGISEAALVAASINQGVTRIAAHPDALMPKVATLGEVMALTRGPSCVHEKAGCYDDYHPGDHAAMVLNADIDLRMFPAHWVHAYAVETGGRAAQAVAG